MSCGEEVFTCLAAISFPRGIGTPFSVAMRFSVARAFSWFPVSTSYRALSGSHWQQPKHIVTARALIHNIVFQKNEGWRDILTKHKMAKMKRGMVDRPSSQRQPRVGITRMAKRTSNTVPRAQNICKTDPSSPNTDSIQELFAGVV